MKTVVGIEFTMDAQVMEITTVDGMWDRIKGKMRVQWGRLTLGDLTLNDGRAQIAGSAGRSVRWNPVPDFSDPSNDLNDWARDTRTSTILIRSTIPFRSSGR